MNGSISRLGRVVREIEIVLPLSLVLWAATLLSVAVAAMGVFITLPKSNVVLPEFTAYVNATSTTEAAAAANYGRIAGGLVMAPVFAKTDQAQAILGSIAFVTFVARALLLRRCWRDQRLRTLLQGALIASALALVAWHNAVVAPRMDDALRSFWDHARAGEVAEADQARATFDADHHAADALFRVRFALVMTAIAVGARRGAGIGGDAPRDSRSDSEPRP